MKADIFKNNLIDSIGLILVVLGALGFIASFVLGVEAFNLLKHPDQKLNCDINPIISCGSIGSTPQATAFGFPNPFIGIVSYSVIITLGVGILAGARYKKWFWLGLQGGVSFGIIMVHWFMYQSIINIGALCPYCMVSWIVTIPIFLYVTLYNFETKNISTKNKKLQKSVDFSSRNHGNILIVWFSIIAIVILNQFWYYWKTLI